MSLGWCDSRRSGVVGVRYSEVAVWLEWTDCRRLLHTVALSGQKLCIRFISAVCELVLRRTLQLLLIGSHRGICLLWVFPGQFVAKRAVRHSLWILRRLNIGRMSCDLLSIKLRSLETVCWRTRARGLGSAVVGAVYAFAIRLAFWKSTPVLAASVRT